MSRAERWWRPATRRRPPLRARQRRTYTEQEVNDTFDRGYRYGEANAREDDGIDKALEVAMDAGAMEGRKQGERNTYLELYQLVRDNDYDELAARISSRALGELADTFLLIESARLNDPDRMRQVADAIERDGEEGKEALERLAREWGVFPEGNDLLDVADAAGVTPPELSQPGQLADEVEAWLARRENEA
ncbi:hypothetical protein ACIBBG_16265 [Micromonospora chersina]|uniref:hypothetical protein n=1 Tax=Micromonospora chersina TaxID=47854 RepID=UPI0037BA524C